MNADSGKNPPRRRGDTEKTGKEKICRRLRRWAQIRKDPGSGEPGNRKGKERGIGTSGNRGIGKAKAYRGSTRMNADLRKRKTTPELIAETVSARRRMLAQVFQRELPDAAWLQRRFNDFN
jgi:hypothetical protein